jgi:hypothetical protein
VYHGIKAAIRVREALDILGGWCGWCKRSRPPADGACKDGGAQHMSSLCNASAGLLLGWVEGRGAHSLPASVPVLCRGSTRW